MKWENMQVSKIETSYLRSCSHVFCRTDVPKISEYFQENTCDKVRFESNWSSSFHNFIKIRPHLWSFHDNISNPLGELFLIRTATSEFSGLSNNFYPLLTHLYIQFWKSNFLLQSMMVYGWRTEFTDVTQNITFTELNISQFFFFVFFSEVAR